MHVSIYLIVSNVLLINKVIIWIFTFIRKLVRFWCYQRLNAWLKHIRMKKELFFYLSLFTSNQNHIFLFWIISMNLWGFWIRLIFSFIHSHSLIYDLHFMNIILVHLIYHKFTYFFFFFFFTSHRFIYLNRNSSSIHTMTCW